ncbi:nickel/cobalt transporter [Aliarcobacter vitoriensis]|uniref:Nickel/cobalt efflux system n=1 Tax=Aliarcobacter vitoriensis TaxID=2011099 RepID=A0A366MVJ7_9BACT|nr:DUF1007 family protein [Aliarcobacter vitoriensis]RBQ29624.1 sodium:proton antiporter [Aliarcobacter vitoriensis]
MIRYFILFLVLKSILLGCSLCSTFTPRTHIFTSIKADNENIKSVNIRWEFAKEFGEELLNIYDLNLNKTFDKNELEIIENSLLDYLVPRDFITTIYYDKIENASEIPFEVKDYKMYYKDKLLMFEYNIELEEKIYDKNIFKIRIFDKEGFFFIVFENKNQKFDIPYSVKKNSNISEVSYDIDAPNLSEQKFSKSLVQSSSQSENLVEKWTSNSENVYVENKEETIEEIKVEKPKNILDDFTDKVKKYLVDIENGDRLALLFLLLASFLYGVVHSIGPGHGKSLAFSYFSSQKSTYFEAFMISLFTAFIHIVGALVIVLISIFALKTVLSGFIADSVLYITALSAVIIMILAIFILYRKLKKKSCCCAVCNTSFEATQFSINSQNINFVKQNSNRPIILEKRSKKQDLIFVLTAGIVPCPGTVLLFVYAFLLQTYFAVFLASLSISLGMAVVIFASSFLGVSLHKISSNSKKFVNIVEIIAPIFMFILAFLMLVGSGIFA